MPRLLSSYAANKRVEDGLKRKQEQIRLDYVRATHRYLDETEKLVDDLIQINVRTPSAFESSCPSSATNHSKRITGNQQLFSPFNNAQQHNIHQPHIYVQSPPQHGSTEQLANLRSRSRGGLANDGNNTDDGTSTSRKEIPLPIVQVRGKDVFYQYENQKSKWKKVEPTYRTKVLLHRNDTVASALKHYSAHKNPITQLISEQSRRSSIVSRRDSDTSRRTSIFSRRGSRRDSGFSTLDESHIPPIVELKPQLSPGHTPRMLDGWTIMNWCLWHKQQNKPVWASKRYMDRKTREMKQFQAARSSRSEVPSKPSSANPSAREARRKESVTEQTIQKVRAKSVPVHRVSMTIEEEDDEQGEKDNFPEPDRGLVRPTTSILRLRRDDEATIAEENRPKTTHAQRRVALDTFTGNGKEHNGDLGPRNDKREKGYISFETQSNHNRILSSKSGIIEGKSVKIREPDGDFEILDNGNRRKSISDADSTKFDLRNRMPGLAATQITIPGVTAPQKNPSLTPIVPLLKPPQKINQTSIQATPIFPKLQNVVPELGTDSPR